jgi:hypothetical protein
MAAMSLLREIQSMLRDTYYSGASGKEEQRDETHAPWILDFVSVRKLGK